MSGRWRGRRSGARGAGKGNAILQRTFSWYARAAAGAAARSEP
jgi:hypothetical protein